MSAKSNSPRRVWSIVVAAGSGTRFGSAKQFEDLDGRTLAEWAIGACRPFSEGVVVVVPAGHEDPGAGGADLVVEGGATRSDSVRAGLASVPETAEVVIVHDAARPKAPPSLFAAVISAVRDGADGAAPGLAFTDTVKRIGEGFRVEATLDRETLRTVQTPQAFRPAVLRRAHASGGEATDDAALVEEAGGTVVVVEGDPANVKVTRPGDLAGLRSPTAPAIRIGHGFDVHRWSDQPRPLVLGGVPVDHHQGLAGHSDADVVCHALADALLGAFGLGDLGHHFPDDDPQWEGVASTGLLAEVVAKGAAEGWSPASADVTVVAEAPKLAHHVDAMSANLSDLTGAPVSVKATRAEGLGALGRGEGMAAMAVALVSRVAPA